MPEQNRAREPAPANEPFGDRLRRLMEERGLGQSDLARLVGVKQPMIHHYLYGGSIPSDDVIEKMATTFGMTTERFLTGTEWRRGSQTIELSAPLPPHQRIDVIEDRVEQLHDVVRKGFDDVFRILRTLEESSAPPTSTPNGLERTAEKKSRRKP